MTAEKGNKVYEIDAASKERYQAAGYDIHGDDGKIIGYAAGKTVPYEKYAKLEEEFDALKKELEALKEQERACENMNVQKTTAKKAASK